MNESTPIFVIGSGRSGTRTIFKLLSGMPDIEIHHEYLCTHIQREACLFHMGILTPDTIKKRLREFHGAAVYYSAKRYWVDCSNKLSWIIQPLHELFPRAKFVNIIRDGRKVASSFFHKLGPEMYDDESVSHLRRWLEDRDGLPMPPPEKKYWWNIPQKGQPFALEFSSFNRLQRCAYHWRESNRVIAESLKSIPLEQQLTVKLEDLTSSKTTLKDFLAFFNVGYQEQLFEFLQTPQNVFFPMDFKLSEEQRRQFFAIAGDMMKELGYANTEEYSVRY